MAFWDNREALTRFNADHPLAAKLAGGWRASLEPIRLYGSWPGAPEVGSDRATQYDGPAIVFTLGRFRVSQLPRFLKASGEAEAGAVVSPGLVWGTALARPPFVATCSIWSSSRAINSYAYSGSEPGHPEAIEAQRRKDFHKYSAFIRFRPYDVHGSLGNGNPLPPASLSA
jgi:hypothetical protein